MESKQMNTASNGEDIVSILEIKQLNKSYPGFDLKNISFQLPYGYIMGLIGANGAGKTTIIKLIMNLINKKDGEIKIFGKDHIENEIENKERIGFVYDSPSFYDHLTLDEMKCVISPYYKKWEDSKFYKYINEFELPLKNKIKTLSRGMRMKFALAIAFSHQAELIIMDEPTAGLDPVFRREIIQLLADNIQDGNKSVLFSTHITSDLEKTADFITFVEKGEVFFSSSKEELSEKWSIVKGKKTFLTEKTKDLFEGIRVHGFGFEGLTSRKAEITKRFNDQLVFEQPSLEDILYFKVKGGKNALLN